MQKLIKLINIISVPLILLNLFGGIISGIWLLVIGNWKLVALSFLIGMIAPGILGFLMLLPGIFAAPAIAIQNNKSLKWLVYILMFASMFLNVLIMCIWGIIVFSYITYNADMKTFIPLYLLSYVVATSPFAYMASKEPADSAGHIYNFWFQVAYLLLIIIITLIGLSAVQALVVLLVIMLVPIIINFYIYLSEQKYSL